MPILPSQQRVLEEVLLPNSEAAKFSRKVDYLIVPIVVFALIAAVHIHFMLLAGDWDFWIDWKDRQYWPIMVPTMLMILVGAIQAIFWEHFRLPIGATICGVVLIIGEWINRIFGFHLWSHFPIAMVWPTAVIASCIFIDLVLLLTKSWMVTALVGALGFALLITPQNMYMMQAYRLPIHVQTDLLSVADYFGFTFTRTAMPEYLRLIERGTLRTFGGGSNVVASFFAGFVCMVIYTLSYHAGILISNLGWGASAFKKHVGFGKKDAVQESEGLGGAV